jgi:hypothetical protein
VASGLIVDQTAFVVFLHQQKTCFLFDDGGHGHMGFPIHDVLTYIKRIPLREVYQGLMACFTWQLQRPACWPWLPAWRTRTVGSGFESLLIQ